VFVLADRDRVSGTQSHRKPPTVRQFDFIGGRPARVVNGFRAYEPLNQDDAATREYVIRGDSEYVDGSVHVNTGETTVTPVTHGSHTSRFLQRQADTVSQSVRITPRTVSKTGSRCTQTHYQSDPLKSTMCYARAARKINHSLSVSARRLNQ